MNRVPTVVLCGLFLTYTSNVSVADDEFVNYVMGDTLVTAWIYDNGPGLTYFAPHDNENTAVAVAMEAVAAHGGRVVQLVHSGKRNVTFRFGDVTYTFDPNRMFSDQGIEATLKVQGKTYSQEAHNMVHAFAQDMLSFVLPQSGPIVAMHNNTDGSYSIQSYGYGGSLVREVSRIYINAAEDPDDFFLVTTPEHYEFFKSKGFNVVLQSDLPTDDGSLSVYCATHKIPYINVEAQEGHQTKQATMLAVLNSN